MAKDAASVDSLEEERRLIERAQRGNLDAMKPILERYASPLYATVILPRVGNAAAAEDVLRDTMATAIEKIDKFRWRGRSIYVWLRQIATNKAYDVHRKSKRTRKLADAIAAEMPTESLPEHQPDAQLIAVEERQRNRERIDATLDKISDRYRMAITLRLIEELPRSECAQRMDVTTGTFDVLLFRAVRAFRKHFGSRNESAE